VLNRHIINGYPLSYLSRGATLPKPDAEGEYLANILRGQRDAPRSLPDGSALEFYTLSPNSRYFIFAGFVFMAVLGLLFYFRIQHVPYTDRPSHIVIMVFAGLLVILAFAFPLLNISRIRRAIQLGISTIGRVEAMQNARTTIYSTPAGMSNGAILVRISYTVDGLQQQSEKFLDRPWISDVQGGTQLELLVDPDKRTILYVVGIRK
jgi:hypothetical protein